MTPSQVHETLRIKLLELAGVDGDGNKILVVKGYANNLRVSHPVEDTGDQADCETKEIQHSSRFMAIWPRSSPEPECEWTFRCKLSEIDKSISEKDDCEVSVCVTEYEQNFTLQAFRCNAWDLLHSLRNEMKCADWPDDFKERPRMGAINQIPNLSTGNEWEDAAETTITVKYCDRAVKVLDCIPYCLNTNPKGLLNGL